MGLCPMRLGGDVLLSYRGFWCLGKRMRNKKATAGDGKDTQDAPAYAFPCSASCPAALQGACQSSCLQVGGPRVDSCGLSHWHVGSAAMSVLPCYYCPGPVPTLPSEALAFALLGCPPGWLPNVPGQTVFPVTVRCLELGSSHRLSESQFTVCVV